MNAAIGIADVDIGNLLTPFVGRRYGPYRAWDAVNAPMIRQWREAISVGGSDETAEPDTAPRAMLNVWMMRGLGDRRPKDSVSDNIYEVAAILREHGYIGVVATKCRQDYIRDLSVGERLSSIVTVERISPRKKTALGVGYFVSLRHEYQVEGEPVGSMLFTTLHYAPAATTPSKPARPQPGISDDTRFFWEGLRRNQLLAQRCTACGTLRHPPGPVCSACHALDWEAVELNGRGAVYSWVVVHHATHPAFDYPHTVGLIELEEGVRMVAPLDGFDAAKLRAGAQVEAVFHHEEGQDLLPSFRPRREVR